MRRHELDLTSLVAGLVFIGIAVAYLIGSYTSVRIDAGWVLPIGLVGLGVAGLAGSLRVGLRRDDPAKEPTPADPAS
jgi:hypothetical protein